MSADEVIEVASNCCGATINGWALDVLKANGSTICPRCNEHCGTIPEVLPIALTFRCEYNGCNDMATFEWIYKDNKHGEISTGTSYRCNRHPEITPEFWPYPII